MAKVKIKHQKSRELNTRTKLLELLSKHQVYATRIVPLDDSLYVLTSDTNEAEKIFGFLCKEELQINGFTPILPPDLKANRTIILTRLDDYIYNNEEEDIREELKHQNEWIGNSITETFKFPKSNTIKITFDHQEKARKSTMQGLLLYNMRVPPHQIQQDEYINLQTCMKCYQIEDHHTNQCPKDPEFKICSECGEEGHHYRNCSNQHKRCINCKEPHRTLAMKCPLRKKALKEKRTANRDNNKTYSNVVQTPTAKLHQFHMEREIPAKILSCMLHAHLMNMGNPGTYEIVLNQTLTLNNLPTIKIPEEPSSAKILNIATTSRINTNENEDQLKDQEHQDLTSTREKRRDPRLEQREKRDHTFAMAEEQCPLTADEIGLRIIMTNKNILPTRDPHIEYVTTMINNGDYKWTFTDTKYDDTTVASWMTNQKIKITKNDFKKVDEGTYRKIRNGLNQRSPLKEQRHSKKSC